MLADILNILVFHKLRTHLFTITYEKKGQENTQILFLYSKILKLSFTIYVLCFII